MNFDMLCRNRVYDKWFPYISDEIFEKYENSVDTIVNNITNPRRHSNEMLIDSKPRKIKYRICYIP